MASAKKCDVCGTLYEQDVRPYIRVVHEMFQGEEIYDLCPECQSKLETWLDDYKEEMTE